MSILDDNQQPLDEDTAYPAYIDRTTYLDDRPDRAIDATPGPLNHWRHSDEFKAQIK
ncbi:MAG: hypothetical protein ACXW1Z_19050 [Methylobacter sp.]